MNEWIDEWMDGMGWDGMGWDGMGWDKIQKMGQNGSNRSGQKIDL